VWKGFLLGIVVSLMAGVLVTVLTPVSISLSPRRTEPRSAGTKDALEADLRALLPGDPFVIKCHGDGLIFECGDPGTATSSDSFNVVLNDEDCWRATPRDESGPGADFIEGCL
jgi:hypothetical protein